MGPLLVKKYKDHLIKVNWDDGRRVQAIIAQGQQGREIGARDRRVGGGLPPSRPATEHPSNRACSDPNGARR